MRMQDLQHYMPDAPAWQIALAVTLTAIGIGTLAAHYLVSGRTTSAERAPPALVVVARSTPIAVTPLTGDTSSSATASRHRTAGLNAIPEPANLATALQTRLRRADCYDGPLDGTWARRSKDAMSRFLAASNAALPVDRPDLSLLATLETNPAVRCSAPLPTHVSPPRIEREPPAGEPAARTAGHFSPPMPLRETASKPNVMSQPATLTPSAEEDRRGANAGIIAIPPIAGTPPPVQAVRSFRSPRVVRVSRPAYRRHLHRRKPYVSISGVPRALTRNVRSLQRAIMSGF